MLSRASLGIAVFAFSLSAYSRPQNPDSHIYRNNSLVDVVVPAHPLILLDEAEIPLLVHAQGLTQVNTVQSYPSRPGESPTGNIPGSDSVLPVLHHPDGSAYIRIIPLGLGKVELGIDGRFPDGGLFFKSIVLDVGPSDRLPQTIRMGSFPTPSGPTPVVLMSMDRRPRNRLILNAQYEAFRYPLTIDASFAQFQVRTEDKSAAIDLNKANGDLQALHPGIAMVESTYAGRRALTCIIVTEKEGGWYDHRGCAKLLKPGEVWPYPSR